MGSTARAARRDCSRRRACLTGSAAQHSTLQYFAVRFFTGRPQPMRWHVRDAAVAAGAASPRAGVIGDIGSMSGCSIRPRQRALSTVHHSFFTPCLSTAVTSPGAACTRQPVDCVDNSGCRIDGLVISCGCALCRAGGPMRWMTVWSVRGVREPAPCMPDADHRPRGQRACERFDAQCPRVADVATADRSAAHGCQAGTARGDEASSTLHGRTRTCGSSPARTPSTSARSGIAWAGAGRRGLSRSR